MHRLQRRFLSVTVVLAVLVSAGLWQFFPRSHTTLPPISPRPTSPAEALERLHQGNQRYVNLARTQSTDTAHDAELRQHTAREQHPFAAIIACSDSRVCPEFIFDQRAGNLFEIRNAGNVIDEDVMGSVEYAVEHLHIGLVLVLGHKGCGAIKAVVEANGQPLHDHLHDLQKHMSGLLPSAEQVKNEEFTAKVNRLAAENARQQAEILLRQCPVLQQAIAKGTTELRYGIYDMESGIVEFFSLP